MIIHALKVVRKSQHCAVKRCDVPARNVYAYNGLQVCVCSSKHAKLVFEKIKRFVDNQIVSESDHEDTVKAANVFCQKYPEWDKTIKYVVSNWF